MCRPDPAATAFLWSPSSRPRSHERSRHRVLNEGSEWRKTQLGCNIPMKILARVNRAFQKNTYLERLQSVLAALEHFANGRFFLSLGEVVHRLVNLDRR